MLFRFLKTLLGMKPSKGAIPKPPSPQDALVKQFRRPVAAQVSVASQKPSRTATAKTTVKLSPAQEEAVRAASGPDPAVFLTGRAGTGKSTIIDYLRSQENVVVCAPTGIAALNCRGATLHSTFKIPPRFLDPQYPNPKNVQGLNKARLLVIDEISMVRADVLDFVSATLQYNRNSSAPFGGLKVIAVGDCRQLPPVVTDQERSAVEARYTSAWWFDAHCMKALTLKVIQLTHIHRQRDPQLIELLEKVRHGSIDSTALTDLNARCYRGPVAPESALILTARRKDAENMNQMKLEAISSQSHIYVATATGSFQTEKDSNVPSPLRLELKVGARVLVTKNHGAIVNGTLGTVTGLQDRSVSFRADGSDENVTLTETNWEQYRYSLQNGQFVPEAIGTYRQIPLTHGWAVTVHKAQGLTLDSVCVDLGSGAFASGQTYVAMSRTRTIDALSTRRPFRQLDFIAERRVSEFHAQHAVL